MYKRLLLLVFLGCCLAATAQQLPYTNEALPFDVRVKDLVSRMTLEEKAGQLMYQSPAIPRLGIVEHNWWNECLHGVARAGLATVFPQAIGMAAMWDKEGMSEIAKAISDEARAKHHRFANQGKRLIYQGLSFWTPNINLFRDPRWGRGMETYGEDPYLTGELAVPFIRGLQGNNPRYLKVIATAKHFAVHSGPEFNRHSFDAWTSKYDFVDSYTPHFKKVVEEAKVYSVMCAYNRLQGMPCCGNTYLEDLLRNKWGFEGYIVSDCRAVRDFIGPQYHNYVKTEPQAAALAVKAGTDLNCGDVYNALPQAVSEGLITEKEIDRSVSRIMMARMRLGMMDAPEHNPYASIPYSVVNSVANQQLALNAARRSMVLLKNAGQALPFSKKIKTIAVIGPNADDLDVLLGNYTGFPLAPKTPLQGIKEKLPKAKVIFAQGCPLAPSLPRLVPIDNRYLFTDKSCRKHGLMANYYDNGKYEGVPLVNRIDKEVNFTWWTNAAAPGLTADNFSAEWNGVLVPPVSGDYAIGGEAFNGFELFIDGQAFTSFQSEHDAPKRYERMHLTAGQSYQIQLKYNQRTGAYPTMKLLWEIPNPNLEQEAISAAEVADVVVLCMGLSPMLEGEELKVNVDGFKKGDKLDIKLPEVQSALIKKITALDKPTVLVLLNGSALAFNWEKEHVPAIIEAWYPGQAGGTALADILFGDYNPSGRLPLTFYQNINDIPPFDDYNMSGKTYRYFEGTPLYEFGYGLSYTTFAYGNLVVPEVVRAGQSLSLDVEVTNTGQQSGEEVVQLYVSHPESKNKTAIRSLQGFTRVSLAPGETQRVSFKLAPEQLETLDSESIPVTETGKLVISVGGKQPDSLSISRQSVVIRTIELIGQ